MENLVGQKFYSNKSVLVTGHTGFKGAWLSLILEKFGAKVSGYALPPEDTRGNLFKSLKLNTRINSVEDTLANDKSLKKIINECNPEIVFHLAAQPIVLSSYRDPIETYQTNVMGTINLLEALRTTKSIKSIVIVTTDKCYQNNEWEWPYRETDALGGHDPYSSSKAMAEIAARTYYLSFFKEKGIGLATGRAGNVIGGGDFAPYRIIPDIVEAIINNQSVVLRYPESIRPWQHVLDALYGYLILGEKLFHDPIRFSTAFNFSPDVFDSTFTVEKVTNTFIKHIGKGSYKVDKKTRQGHEASVLRLDSSRARSELGWNSALTTREAINQTADWYKDFVQGKDISKTTETQITNYFKNFC